MITDTYEKETGDTPPDKRPAGVQDVPGGFGLVYAAGRGKRGHHHAPITNGKVRRVGGVIKKGKDGKQA